MNFQDFGQTFQKQTIKHFKSNYTEHINVYHRFQSHVQLFSLNFDKVPIHYRMVPKNKYFSHFKLNNRRKLILHLLSFNWNRTKIEFQQNWNGLTTNKPLQARKKDPVKVAYIFLLKQTSQKSASTEPSCYSFNKVQIQLLISFFRNRILKLGYLLTLSNKPVEQMN